MNWLRHAFALDPPGPAEPTDAQRSIVERVCRAIVERHLTLVALPLLEMCRPFNALAANSLYFLSPALSVLLTGDDHRRFAEFLERRGSIDHLRQRIEELEHRALAVNAARRLPSPASEEPLPQAPPLDRPAPAPGLQLPPEGA